ncbi:hypothetical protein K1X84_05420 [bacterium]|nr:hypothetical protein [bacterium]
MEIKLDHIPDYIENRLSAEESDYIAKLIKTDPDWHKSYNEILSTMTAIGKTKQSFQKTPDNYWNHFSARLQGRIYKQQHNKVLSRRRFQIVFPVTTVACAIIVFMFMIVKTDQKINYVYQNLNWSDAMEEDDLAYYSNDADQLWDNYFGSISESEFNQDSDPVSGSVSPLDRVGAENELNKLSHDEEMELLKELNENVII